MKPGFFAFNCEQSQSGKYDVVARDGSKPSEVHLFGSKDTYPLGVVHEDGVVVMHTLDGVEVLGEATARDLFLREKGRTMFVNVYEHESFGIPRTKREDADDAARMHGTKRIACVEVTYTPGQGL